VKAERKRELGPGFRTESYLLQRYKKPDAKANLFAFSRGGILRRLKKLGDRKHSNINYLFVSSQETGAGRNNATGKAAGTAPV
jgi:hypothetical protein